MRVLPAVAEEIQAVILVDLPTDNPLQLRHIRLGDLKNLIQNLPQMTVRLGTHVSESYPSCVGFRIFLRDVNCKVAQNGEAESLYHIVSLTSHSSESNQAPTPWRYRK